MVAWIISGVSATFLLIAIIYGIIDSLRKRNRKESESSRVLIEEYEKMNFLPYCLNNSLLTKKEAVIYNYIVPIARRHNLVICVKPRIADYVSVTLNQYEKGTQFYRYFNRISNKHVDFLLCSGFTLKPVLAIEIDDTSHNRADRMERDNFVDLVYHVVELNVIHLDGFITQAQVEAEINKYTNLQEG